VYLRSVLQLLVTANVVPSSLILSIQLVFLRIVLNLLVTVNIVPSSQVLCTVMMEAIRSTETSFLKKSHKASHPITSAMDAIRCFETPVLRRATRRHITEDGILNSRFVFVTNEHMGRCDTCRLVNALRKGHVFLLFLCDYKVSGGPSLRKSEQCRQKYILHYQNNFSHSGCSLGIISRLNFLS
jgi:hypothetical protein